MIRLPLEPAVTDSSQSLASTVQVTLSTTSMLTCSVALVHSQISRVTDPRAKTHRLTRKVVPGYRPNLHLWAKRFILLRPSFHRKGRQKLTKTSRRRRISGARKSSRKRSRRPTLPCWRRIRLSSANQIASAQSVESSSQDLLPLSLEWILLSMAAELKWTISLLVQTVSWAALRPLNTNRTTTP